jgi:hypothetical protein
VLFGGYTVTSYALWVVLTIASAFIYTWVFNNTAGSILLAALLHAAINMGSGLVTGLTPGLEGAFRVQAYGAVAIAFVAVVLVLVTATRGRLGYRAHTASPEPSARN